MQVCVRCVYIVCFFFTVKNNELSRFTNFASVELNLLFFYGQILYNLIQTYGKKVFIFIYAKKSSVRK